MLKPDAHLVHRVKILLKDRVPENRLLALAQVEATLPIWPDRLVEELVEPLKRDAHKAVAAAAGHALARHAAERLARPGRRRTRPLLGSVTAADLARVPALAAIDLEEVRGRLKTRIEPALVRLCDQINAAGAEALARDIEAAGALGWAGALPTLKHAARWAGLQAPCVKAFDRIGDKVAQAAICELAKSESAAGRGAALEALGGCSANDAIPLLAEAMKRDAPEQLVALRALANLNVPRGWPLILAALADPEPLVAVAAVRALGQISDEAFAGPLVVAARHADERVRATAASALGRVVMPEGRDTVLAMCKDANARVAANAVESSLPYQVDNSDARRLYFDLIRSPHLRVRANAVVHLWPFNAEQAGFALAKMLRSPKPGERATAYWAASQVAAPQAVRDLVEAALPEDDPRAVERALDAFDELDRPDTLAPVRRALMAPQARMRIRAAGVLARVGRASELGHLLGHFKAEADPRVKSAILRAVAQLSPEEALARLPRAGEPDADRTTANVVDGLGEAGHVASAPFVQPMLTHRSARVRGSAVVAMVSLGHFESLDLLAELQEKAPATASWVIVELGRRLTPAGLEANPALAAALARSPSA